MERESWLIEELRSIDSLVVRKPVILSSGTESDYKIDLEQAEKSTLARILIASLLLEKIPYEVKHVVAEGGARWIARSLEYHSRDAAKATYLDDINSRVFSGHSIPPDARCCVIEDVVTTGGTMVCVGTTVEEELGAVVDSYIAVVKRPEQEIVVPEHASFSYLIRADDLL